jgi:RNA polymerase sigma factor (sigma-70 family)
MNLVYLHRRQSNQPSTDEQQQRDYDALTEARELLAAMLSLAERPQPSTQRAQQRRQTVTPTAVIASALGGGTMLRAQRAPSPVEILAHALRRPASRSNSAPSQPAKPAAPNSVPDGEAFWRMWNMHRDFLFRRCLRLLGGNFADAEDALSEAMVKAAQAFRAGDIRSERAWLLRLTHNACMDQYRNHRRQTRLADEIGADGAETVAAVVPGNARSPEEHLGAAHLLRDLQRGIAALPEALSLPLLMNFQERSDDEIAAALNVTKDVVRKRRQIAREKLRQALRDR